VTVESSTTDLTRRRSPCAAGHSAHGNRGLDDYARFEVISDPDAPTVDQRPTVPTQVPHEFGDRYAVVKQLGNGAMGVVYEVVDRELEEHVALKVLYGEELPPDAVARLKAEVRLARRVTHRNVVRIYDVGTHGRASYFTMELVTGGTLRDRLIAGQAPHDEALRIALQIALGLEAAHAAQVMHRDLKPSNVLLTPEGRAVVSDFGLARVLGGLVTDEVSGTPGYMAPEQQRGEDLDPRADVYAFGAILRELTASPALLGVASQCTRDAPGERPTSAELVRALQALEGVVPAPAARPAEISQVQRTLAIMPPHAGNLDAELAHAFAGEMVDALVRSRGLRVLGPSVTQAMVGLNDPRRIGAALGATSLVETELALKNGRLRVGARLIDANDGRQLFSERFEDELGAGLQLLETLSTRVAESLRIGIDAVANRGAAPSEVVELYLRGRAQLERERIFGPDGAIELLEAALSKAPDFGPALAAAAMAHARGWFAGTVPTGALERARSAVDRCAERAPALPETLLARGQLHRGLGEHAQAVSCLVRALSAAPSLALAHQWLSEIELESGRTEDGLRRARHAIELDPHLALAHANLFVRLSFLTDPGPAEQLLKDAEARRLLDTGPLFGTRLRVAIWRKDLAQAERLVTGLRPSGAIHAAFSELLRFVRGETDELPRAPKDAPPTRAALTVQLGIEAAAVTGRWALVWPALDELAELPFIDVDWMTRCPVLAPVHGDARYQAVLRQVSARASSLWTSEGEITKVSGRPGG
jgi:serine/threonine-protein kinase